MRWGQGYRSGRCGHWADAQVWPGGDRRIESVVQVAGREGGNIGRHAAIGCYSPVNGGADLALRTNIVHAIAHGHRRKLVIDVVHPAKSGS